MNVIFVRFFASIREQLGRGHDEVDPQGVENAADVWRLVAGSPAPANILVAINQEYASLDHAVHGGDEVAFFPPVTGG
ncbi:MAG: MoaD/ThiS family protein [Acidiferrobacterales bacterium]